MKNNKRKYNVQIKNNLIILVILSTLFAGVAYLYNAKFDYLNSNIKLNKLIEILYERPVINERIITTSNKNNFLMEELRILNSIIKESKNISLELDERSRNNLSNLNVLKENYDSAIRNANGEGYNYYFNIGNINTIKGYLEYSSGDIYKINKSYEYFVKGINNYKTSIDLLTGKLELNINESELLRQSINNLTVATKLKYLVNVESCIFYVKEIVEKINGLIDFAGQLVKIFNKEMKLLEELLPNDDLEIDKCLQEYRKTLETSIYNTEIIIDFLKNSKIATREIIEKSIEDDYSCPIQKDKEIKEIKESVEGINNSLNKFYGIHNNLLNVFMNGSIDDIRSLCENSQQHSQQSQQINDELNQSINKLNKLLTRQQGSQGGEQQEKQEGEGEQQDNQQNNQGGENNEDQQNQQDQQNGANNSEYHYKLNGEEERIIEDIERKQDNWIEQMENMKGDKNYNPGDFIDQLFKDFQGEGSDFYNRGGNEGPKFDNNW